MDKNTKKLEEVLEILKADDLGQVSSPSGDEMPRPISNKISAEIVQKNYLRRLFPSIVVPKSARSITIPCVAYGTNNVKVVSYGTDVSELAEDTFTTGSIVVEPRLLVAHIDIIEDDLETAAVDLAKWAKNALITKLSAAEEMAMAYGVYASSGSAYTISFDGIHTVAAGTGTSVSATSKIPYNSADKLTSKISDAKKALGVYGQNPSDIVCICDSTFANKLRQEDLVYSQNYRIDTDVLKTGTLPPIMGVTIIESAYLNSVNSGSGVGILVRKDAFIVGVRQNLTFRTRDIIETFSKRIIICESIDFKPVLKNNSGTFEGVVELYATGS